MVFNGNKCLPDIVRAGTVLLSVTVSIFISDTIIILMVASEQVKGSKKKTKTDVSQQMKQGVGLR